MERKEVKQYEVYWTNLDPVQGSEIAKTRPCAVISPDELNRHLRTVIVAPLTSTVKSYPYRVTCTLSGKIGEIALDQIRTVDRSRICAYIGRLNKFEAEDIRKVLRNMFD
jgi:mRNA interferase MazF